MAMHVRISESALLPGLVDLLLANGCVAHVVGDDACVVVHVQAGDADEARRELAFFLRAWQLEHSGVSAVVGASG
jgi:hypothetical protein